MIGVTFLCQCPYRICQPAFRLPIITSVAAIARLAVETSILLVESGSAFISHPIESVLLFTAFAKACRPKLVASQRVIIAAAWLLFSPLGCPRRRPFVPGLELQSEPDVIHAQIAICTAHNRIRNDFRDLLRHDADVELVAPAVAVAIEAYAVTETRQLNDVPL